MRPDRLPPSGTPLSYFDLLISGQNWGVKNGLPHSTTPMKHSELTTLLLQYAQIRVFTQSQKTSLFIGVISA